MRAAHNKLPGAMGEYRRKDGNTMKTTKAAVALMIIASIQAVPPLPAKDKPTYDRGVLLQMDSTHCGYAEKEGKTVAGEIFGTDGQHKNTQEVLCQEYILKSERLIYRIRPKDDKHPTLLPVGESAEFRIHKDKMLLRVPDSDGKEREYIVVSMTTRADVTEARATAKTTNQ
jgi:hypothetical protein